MKTHRSLLLSALLAVAIMVVSVCVHAADAERSVTPEMQEALEQLDTLLKTQNTQEAAPDALLQLQELQAEFEDLRAALASRDLELAAATQALAAAEQRINVSEASGGDAQAMAQEVRIKNLEDESQVLKEEIDRQHQRAEKAETAYAKLAAQPADAVQVEGLKEELAAAQALVSDLDVRLKEKPSPSADESWTRELMASMEDMKAVDAQRKEAMDDLFRQLAAQKKEMGVRDAELVAVQADLTQAHVVIGERERDLGVQAEQLVAQEKALATVRAEQESLNAKLLEVGQISKASADLVALREAELKTLQKEMDRVKLVDEQRRQTLDETLAALAEARQRVSTLSSDLEQTRAEQVKAMREAEDNISVLTDRKAVLDREIEQMEKDAAAACESRDVAQAKLQELRTELTERDRQVVDLEAQVSRLSAVDDQRRKAMDRILLDVATLEQDRGKLQAELQKLQTTSVAPYSADRGAALEEALAEASREMAVLQTRNAALESALQERGAELPSVSEAMLTSSEQAVWQQEKIQMDTQLRDMNLVLAHNTERMKEMEQELEQARQANTDLVEQMKDQTGRKPDIRESDLYKELEQVNSMLREKMLEIESERQRLALAEQTAAKRDAEQKQAIGAESQARATAETALTEALARESEYKELIERVVPQVADLETQVTALSQERQELTDRLRGRDEDLQALKVELERREHRLAKAERVAEVLDKARTEVTQAGDREKLNMHYNMASVYAREGKFEESEREYLQALRIDPTDADVHYNLGILYDDEMKQPEKAALHYRRYLQLSPHGPDADRVRNWLMKLEMRTQL